METKHFNLGELVQTSGIYARACEDEKFFDYVQKCFGRFMDCDWGEMCEEDKEMNDLALKDGGRIFASYEKEGMPKIWIITEWDRSVTTILFPSEY